jgi:hypothetical protein
MYVCVYFLLLYVYSKQTKYIIEKRIN